MNNHNNAPAKQAKRKKERDSLDEVVEAFVHQAEIHKALGHTLRMLITVKVLETGKKGIRSSVLAGSIGLSPAMASKHLKILENALVLDNVVTPAPHGIESRYFATRNAEAWFRRSAYPPPAETLERLLDNAPALGLRLGDRHEEPETVSVRVQSLGEKTKVPILRPTQ